MEKEIRVGIIGLGKRGRSIFRCVLQKMEGVKVVALCDTYFDRTQDILEFLKKDGKAEGVLCTTDYKEALDCKDLDCVYIACAWETHCEVAIAALKKGIPVACEVGGAYDLDECYDLVKVYEETKTPIMFMENCYYNKIEMTIFNMADDNFFGDIVYCSGAYGHDLREEVACGVKNRHYRENNYLHRNCENYPTHELGPIARLLKINRGNRFTTLFSASSCAKGMEAYVKANKKPHDEILEGKSFAQGDIVTTLITCEDGSLVQLKLDTTLPRSYSRELHVAGTKARYTQLYDEVFVDGEDEMKKSKSLDEYSKYRPEIWSEENEAIIKERGHGGMDWLVFEDFFKHLRENKPMPIDVYDMVALMAVTPLSEISIKEKRVVDFPDFTNGAYKTRR